MQYEGGPELCAYMTHSDSFLLSLCSSHERSNSVQIKKTPSNKKKVLQKQTKKTEFLKKKTAQKRQQKCFGEDNNVREHFLKSQANSICTYGIICIIRLIPSTESSVSFNHATEPWVSFTSAANV